MDRLNIRLKIAHYNFYFSASHVQTVAGIYSQIEFNKHIVLWDFDNTALENVASALRYVQLKYNLGKIDVLSDKEGSYHAVCFTIVDYPTLLKILVNTDGVDIGFIQWTARLGQSALRLSPKKDRGKMRLVHTLEGRSETIPQKLKAVEYDIPLSRGVTIGH